MSISCVCIQLLQQSIHYEDNHKWLQFQIIKSPVEFRLLVSYAKINCQSLLNVCKQHSLIDLFSDQVLINYTSYIKWLLSVYHYLPQCIAWLTNREALTALCSFVKHAGSGQSTKEQGETQDLVECFSPLKKWADFFNFYYCM